MHDLESEALVPPEVSTQARRILRRALGNLGECGERGYALGWLLEAHTVGCMNDIFTENQKMDMLYTAYLMYVNDGRSVVMGDPGEGAFVSATPVEDGPGKMGSQELVELGSHRRKRLPAKGKKRK